MMLFCQCASLCIQSSRQPAGATEEVFKLAENGIDDDGNDGIDEAIAQMSPFSAPISQQREVVPELWSGAPDRVDVGYAELCAFGIAAPLTQQRYYLTGSDGEIIGGPEDTGNWVDVIVNQSGNIVDWYSTLLIEAVIVQAAGQANVYIYNPGIHEDTYLGSPELADQISSVTFLYSYELGVALTANANRAETYTWAVDKSADFNVHSGFAGESFVTSYTVAVDRTVEMDETVSGIIIISNPYPDAVTITASALLDGSVPADVAYPNGQTVAAHETLTCTYSAPVDALVVTVNVVNDNSAVQDGTASVPVVPDSSPTIIGYPSVFVNDTGGESWQAFEDSAWTYNKLFTAPTDITAYTGGINMQEITNTATILETGQSDSEAVNVTAYAPLVSVNALDSYTRSYAWAIDKQASPSSHSGFAGDSFLTEYAISVDQTVDDYDFMISGTILIMNPNPERALLDGLGVYQIAKFLTDESVPMAYGGKEWTPSHILKDLTNEKYMGDTRFHKTFNADYLTKRRVKNTGQLPQYYRENTHAAIPAKNTLQIKNRFFILEMRTQKHPADEQVRALLYIKVVSYPRRLQRVVLRLL